MLIAVSKPIFWVHSMLDETVNARDLIRRASKWWFWISGQFYCSDVMVNFANRSCTHIPDRLWMNSVPFFMWLAAAATTRPAKLYRCAVWHTGKQKHQWPPIIWFYRLIKPCISVYCTPNHVSVIQFLWLYNDYVLLISNYALQMCAKVLLSISGSINNF